MASVFKRGRDQGKRRTPWYFAFTDHAGKRRVRKGFTDKVLTEQLAAKAENESMLRSRGLIDPQSERLAEERGLPIEKHLKAFEQSLAKTTGKHVKLTISRVRRLIQGCKFATLADLNGEAVEIFLNELSEKEDLGHRTYNHYLQAIDSFGNWLVSTKRSAFNPTVGMERQNTAVDVRHQRRALKSSEFASLVQSARGSGEDIQCFSGEERARIYLISYLTGLRRKEIGSLTPRSFSLDSSPATVTIQAACSKHRRTDVLPLHPALVAMLRVWLAGKGPSELLFPKLEKRRTWLMVKKDLERVGIAYENEVGIADFHAAGRHTHITELLRNGVTLPEAKELARHTDVKMTMRYTHIGIDDQARAVASLPMPKAPLLLPGPVNSAPVSDSAWQRIGSAQDGQALPSDSSSVPCCPVDQKQNGFRSPSAEGTSVHSTTKEGRGVTTSHDTPQKWRRRE